jgi:TRAP-type uncharacterized transport system substrate-binding protein
MRLMRFSWSDGLASVAPVLLAVLVCAALSYYFIDPAPPKNITMLAGDEDSEYSDFAKSYQHVLRLDGITLEVQPSRGAMDNIRQLRDPHAKTDIAFLQAGLSPTDSNDADANDVDLESLGSVAYEPVWIFHHGKPGISRLTALRGKRIGIGAIGSGTHVLALRLLQDAGVNATNSTLVDAGHDASMQQFIHRRLDAVFFMGAPDSALVKQLVATPGVEMLGLDQAEAYVRRFPYLHHLVLPHGALDVGRNLPATDVHLLATTTIVAVRDTLHPAIVALIMKAMKKTHDQSDLLTRAMEFPAPKDLDLPLNEDAQHFYKSGPPLLQRYLPFWLATLIDRMAIAILPLLAVLIPVVRSAPGIYRWRIRRRIYRWYGELKFLETEIRQATDPAQRQAIAAKIDQIEDRVTQAQLPLAYADFVYDLKQHIEFVRRRVVA